MQRRIVDSLDQLADYQRPELWYDIVGLGIAEADETPDASLSSSYRRAAARLAAADRIEIAYAWTLRFVTNAGVRYQKFDEFGLAADFATAGVRRHIVVRYPLSEEDLAQSVQTHQRHSDMWREGLRTVDRQWDSWYDKQYTFQDGVYFDVVELVQAGLIVHRALGRDQPARGLEYGGWVPPSDE